MSMTEKLAYIKKLRRLTTQQISRQSGVPVGTLNKIFSGQTRHPAVEQMDRIAQVLRVPIHYLLDDELPLEAHLSVFSEDGLMLLSEEEVRLLMKYRDLESSGRRALDALAELLSEPPARLAGNVPVKRTFCYLTSALEGAQAHQSPFLMRPVLIPETCAAVREADFAVLLSDGSMEPLYPSGTVLLCRRDSTPRQGCGLFLLNREALVRRLQCRRGVTKLVALNVAFKDIVVRADDRLECIGVITGSAKACRWE